MSITNNLIAFLLSFLFMEFVAWFTHKYVMHGFMWYFHEDHHNPKFKKHQFFEKNDIFFLVFAIPSFFLIFFGIMYEYYAALAIGSGIASYGIFYFLVHEVYIHRRFNWFKDFDNFFWRALRKAHKVHHKHLSREDGECFGLFIIPLKYYKEAWESSKKK